MSESVHFVLPVDPPAGRNEPIEDILNDVEMHETPAPGSVERESLHNSLRQEFAKSFRFAPNESFNAESEKILIRMAWDNLFVKVRQNTLLHGVSGFLSNGLTCIMGPSGSGKTTLLNTLACRLDPAITVEGELTINGEPYTNSTLKRFLGYVMQDDLLVPQLTVSETLRFMCELRLPKDAPAGEAKVRVERVLQQMTLKHCANTLIGGIGTGGISAGERKRLCVAMELLSMPRMLFLDEPTSNLDSLDAYHFAKALKDLVSSGVCPSIVCTIHQPQYKVFMTFERLILLRSGLIVYDDATTEVPSHCERIGIPCPPNVNPIDHLMFLITPNFNDSFATEERKKEQIAAHFQKFLDPTSPRASRPIGFLRIEASWKIQVQALLRKNYNVLKRRQKDWNVNLIQTIINACFIGGVFFAIGNDELSVKKRLPALFFTIINQSTFAAISSVNAFPSERNIALRDRASGHYSASAYYVAKVISEWLWRLPFPLIFSIIVYWMIGFRAGAGHFFLFILIQTLVTLAACTLAMAVSTLSRVAEMATLILPLVMEANRLFGGFFVAPVDQKYYFLWLDRLSYIHYGYIGIAVTELRDLPLTCTKPPCAYSNGSQQIAAMQLDEFTALEAIFILILYIFVCFLLGYGGMRWLKW